MLFGFALTFLRYANLRAICFAVWTATHPASTTAAAAPEIANAIANAVAMDPTPIYGDPTLEAALMARWALEESGLSVHPRPFSWDSRAGVSCGVWQERCATIAPTVEGQAAVWLALAHDGAVRCPESPLAPLSGRCGGSAKRTADRRVSEVLKAIGAQP